MLFLSIADYYFFNGLFIKSLRNTTRESNSLEQDQARLLVGPNLDPNYLQRVKLPHKASSSFNSRRQ